MANSRQRYSQRTRSSASAYARSGSRQMNSYVAGNAIPQTIPQPEPTRRKRTPRRSPADEARRRRRRMMARRNQQRELMMNRSYVFFLACATIVCALFCGVYISMRASLVTNISQVTVMQEELSQLRADNDAIEKELKIHAENLSLTKEKAAKLGLSYPAEKQLVYYAVDSSDYMNVMD